MANPHAIAPFLDLLAKAEEDYVTDPCGDGTVHWHFIIKAQDMMTLAHALGFIDLHDALYHAHKRANEKNILTD